MAKLVLLSRHAALIASHIDHGHLATCEDEEEGAMNDDEVAVFIKYNGQLDQISLLPLFLLCENVLDGHFARTDRCDLRFGDTHCIHMYICTRSMYYKFRNN